MASEVETAEDWPSEAIPGTAKLYYRVHRNDLRDGEPKPGAFRNHPRDVEGSGMSTDWEKYSTSQETRHRGPQPPENYAVVELIVNDIRNLPALPSQIVEHTPDHMRANRAHTDVFGEKTTEVRAKLMECYKMSIKLDA